MAPSCAAGVRLPVNESWLLLDVNPILQTLNLEAAGVALTPQGFVQTNAKLQTSNKTVYAAGDCTATLQFTHHADAQARALIQNTLFAPTAKVDGLIPHCTYTDPEVASVGENPASLESQGVAFDTYEFDLSELDRSGRSKSVRGRYPTRGGLYRKGLR